MGQFVSPKVIFGTGALSKLADEVRGKGTKAVIITDKVAGKLHADKVVEILKAEGYEVRIFDEVEPDPSLQTARKGAELLSEFQPQWVIGLGGGSSIDAGKLIWVLYERPEFIYAYIPDAINPTTRLNLRKKARYVAIPTTSGTGADVDWSVIITETEAKRKIPFANLEMIPDVSIVEPTLALTQPKGLTAGSGIDVLAHAIEGYTARWANDFSDGLCLQAIKMVFEWLPKAYAEGTNLMAREKIHNAATIAGLGMGNSNTQLAHSLGHTLGIVFRLPHGQVIGVLLPYSIQFNAKVSSEKYALIARLIGIDAKSPEEATEKLITKVKDLAKSLNLPSSLKDLGISREDMEKNMNLLISSARMDPNTATCPRRPVEFFEKLFWYSWEGKDVDF